MARIGVLGATGLVGERVLSILAQRNFPIDELRVYASERSVGRTLTFQGSLVTCELPAPGAFAGLDLVIVDVETDVAQIWVPVIRDDGALVVDNSSAYREDEDVPLVIAEVNPQALTHMPKGIVSCPNCTTMVLLTAVGPLHAQARLRRMVVTTYQSVSGAGVAGIAELDNQWDALAGHGGGLVQGSSDITPSVWEKQVAGNVIPLLGDMTGRGYTSEELKMVSETRKILDDETISVAPTCVRVPVYVGHSMSVNAQFAHHLGASAAEELLASAPGVTVAKDGYPTPLEAAGQDDVFVGRIRADLDLPGGLNFWVTGDNLRKGAALNAVQLAELVMGTR